MAERPAKYRTEIQQMDDHFEACLRQGLTHFIPYEEQLEDDDMDLDNLDLDKLDLTVWRKRREQQDSSAAHAQLVDRATRCPLSLGEMIGADIIHKMMFVSGETGEATPETTTLIEGIVQQQVIEMLTRSTSLAARRGHRAINTDDLIFLIRHDRAKVARLRTFLSWKDVRKSAKDSDDKGGGGGGDQLDDFDIGGTDPAMGNRNAPAKQGSGPAGPGGNKKAKVGLPWDVASFYSEQVPEREDEEDEEEEEMNAATLARLKSADERTKNMTPEEYLHWSECRQASFTFRKGKRFREWAGFGVVTEAKPNDDIVDILGFLTFEIVQTLTEEALRVKAAEDANKRDRGNADGGGDGSGDGDGDGGGGADDGNGGGGAGGDDDDGDGPSAGRKRKRREPGLFDPPEEARTPVGPRHIQEAFRRLQRPELKKNYMGHIAGRTKRQQLKLI